MDVSTIKNKNVKIPSGFLIYMVMVRHIDCDIHNKEKK